METPKLSTKFPEKGGAHFAEKPLDGESVAGFMHSLVEDLTKLRKEAIALESVAQSSEEERQEKLREMAADMVMLQQHLEKAIEQVRLMESHATYDVLTGLPNKRALHETLQTEISLINRFEGKGGHESAHAIFIDFDGFKAVNDTLGHEAGDLYLKKGAEYMKREIHRSTDMIARNGGDEFVAVLFGVDDEFASNVAKKLVDAVREASLAAKGELRGKGVEVSDEQGNISASIGLASHRHKESSEEFLNRADEAMYEAKTSGKDQVAIAK